MSKYVHGLCVMRAQPFHIGHQRIIDKMLDDCEYATVVLGSIQEQGTSRNPLSFELRKEMIQNIYASQIKEGKLIVVGLHDINNSAEWGKFVVDFIKRTFPELPKSEVYYAGSNYDAHWFAGVIKHIEIIERNDNSFVFVSGTMIRDMIRYGDTRWKDFIAKENHKLLEDYFVERKGII